MRSTGGVTSATLRCTMVYFGRFADEGRKSACSRSKSGYLSVELFRSLRPAGLQATIAMTAIKPRYAPYELASTNICENKGKPR